MATAGGLVAVIWGGDVSDSYATGRVSAEGGQEIVIGGLNGMLSFNGHISRCYAVGLVECIRSSSAPFLGGLVGEDYTLRFQREVRIDSSYYDKDTTGQSDTRDIISHDGSYLAYPSMARTTLEMQTQSTFEDWDFNNVWMMPAESGYPILR
jgi:hypothetical protein